MAAERHLGFLGRTLVDDNVVVSIIRYAKFSWNRCCSFDNMKLLIFCSFGLKTPIHAQKMGVGEEFHLQNEQQYQPKRHTLRVSTSFEPSDVKNRRRV